MHVRVSRTLGSVAIGAGVLGLLGVGGCSSSSSTGPGKPEVTVRFMQAAAGVGGVDLYDSASGRPRSPVVHNLTLGQTDTLTTGGGPHWYNVTLTGQTGTISALPQAGSVQLLVGFGYDVIVLDSGAAPVIIGQLLPTAMPDTQSTNTKIRLVQGADTLGGVDIYFLSGGASLAGASPQFSDLTFPLNTSTNGNPTYYDATSGSAEIVVMPTGNTTQSEAYVDTTVSLTAGQAWTTVLVPRSSGPRQAQLVWLRDK